MWFALDKSDNIFEPYSFPLYEMNWVDIVTPPVSYGCFHHLQLVCKFHKTESCGLFIFVSPGCDSPDGANAVLLGAMQVTENLAV